MGLFDSIFGGSSQSSQSTQQSSAQSFIDPSQMPFLTALRGAGSLQLQPGGQAQQFAQGLAGAQGQLIGQSVGPEATMAQLGALSSLVGRQQELGLNSIANRFGQAGTTGIGGRAAVTGQELVGNLGIPFAQGIAGILGQQSALGLQGASQIPSIFGTNFANLGLGQQLIGSPTILNQAQSSGTRTSSGSETGGILGSISGTFGPFSFG